MEVSLRGWRRDHGKRTIGSIAVDDNTVDRDDPLRTAYRNYEKVYVSDDGVDVTWRADLRLTGEYRVDVVISKEEIDTLFKYVHSDRISKDQLLEIGIYLDDIPPSEEAIEQAIREMPVGSFLKLIGARQ